VTSFPKNPAVKAAASIADHGRQVTRAHARLDQVESTNSQQASQITTANTAITANTTAITANTTAITTANTTAAALDTRLGGSSQETFLGSLNQATAPSNPAHSGIGTISGTPTDVEYNATNSCLNNLVDTVATLISRLDATNILQ
jgi:hypothetical protein